MAGEEDVAAALREHAVAAVASGPAAVWAAAREALSMPIDGVVPELDEDLLMFETGVVSAPYPRQGEDFVVSFTRHFSAGGGDMRHVSLLLRWDAGPEDRARRSWHVAGTVEEVEAWVAAVEADRWFRALEDRWPPAAVEVDHGLI